MKAVCRPFSSRALILVLGIAAVQGCSKKLEKPTLEDLAKEYYMKHPEIESLTEAESILADSIAGGYLCDTYRGYSVRDTIRDSIEKDSLVKDWAARYLSQHDSIPQWVREDMLLRARHYAEIKYWTCCIVGIRKIDKTWEVLYEVNYSGAPEDWFPPDMLYINQDLEIHHLTY